MWVRTLEALRLGKQEVSANTRVEVDEHVGRLLVRRGLAETITVMDETAMAAVLTPDQAAQKSVEK